MQLRSQLDMLGGQIDAMDEAALNKPEQIQAQTKHKQSIKQTNKTNKQTKQNKETNKQGLASRLACLKPQHNNTACKTNSVIKAVKNRHMEHM